MIRDDQLHASLEWAVAADPIFLDEQVLVDVEFCGDGAERLARADHVGAKSVIGRIIERGLGSPRRRGDRRSCCSRHWFPCGCGGGRLHRCACGGRFGVGVLVAEHVERHEPANGHDVDAQHDGEGAREFDVGHVTLPVVLAGEMGGEPVNPPLQLLQQRPSLPRRPSRGRFFQFDVDHGVSAEMWTGESRRFRRVRGGAEPRG